MKASTKAAVLGAIFAAGVGIFCLVTPLGDGLVSGSYDLPFKFRPFILPKEVVMVYLDDASHEKLHQKYLEPWSRAYYTKLLNRLTADHARAVVFDIIFGDAMDAATDQAFANAMEANGKVVIGAELATVAYGLHGPTGIKLMPPARIFEVSAADLGLDGVFPDRDMEIRMYAPTTKLPGEAAPLASEAWAGATLADPSLLTNNGLRDSTFWMNYYGPETLTLPFVSLYQAVADSDPHVPTGYFSNKVVFVGERLMTHGPDSRKDEYATPYSWLPQNRFMSGVGLQATACLNMLRRDYLRRLDWNAERNLILLLGVLFGAGLVLLRPGLAVIVAVLLAVLIGLLDYLCFAKLHYWFPCLIPMLVQIPVALVWSISSNSVRIYRELRALRARANP